MTERELRAQCLEHDCPECGAKPGHRCGYLSKREDIPGYPPARRHWTGLAYPHDARVALAWRVHLSR